MTIRKQSSRWFSSARGIYSSFLKVKSRDCFYYSFALLSIGCGCLQVIFNILSWVFYLSVFYRLCNLVSHFLRSLLTILSINICLQLTDCDLFYHWASFKSNQITIYINSNLYLLYVCWNVMILIFVKILRPRKFHSYIRHMKFHSCCTWSNL